MACSTFLTQRDHAAINAAKAMTADAVEKAGSGHPGTAISLAGVAYLLYQYEMVADPADARWLGRDRFVLSAGHASLLQYVQLMMAGYGLEISDIEQLRQWGSLTPGHPEYGHTVGVETTTGPLGAGFTNAVGMAMASRRAHGMLDPQTPAGESIFDHRVYTIVGDGCLQEGLASEAASLAGTLKLGNLIAIYDDNDISIEGDTDLAFTEDPSARFEAYGWQVLDVNWRAGGQYEEDYDALHEALEAARADAERPTLIRLRTIIAWPAPTKQGTESSHGAKLGAEEVAGLKRALGLDETASFQMDPELLAMLRRRAAERGRVLHEEWTERYEQWAAAHPDKVALLERIQAGELPEGLDDVLPTWEQGDSVATRNASGAVLTALGAALPELWGGSADLASSNKTTIGGTDSFLPGDEGIDGELAPNARLIHFGVREHAMGGIVNGIALDGLTRPYGGTFMVFSDYMRPAVRLAAIMRIPSTFVWTHDSINVGEDGPTHQPIEHLASLRAIPGLDVVRPADANETAAAWLAVLRRRNTPAGLVLSRQNLPVVTEADQVVENVARGAYVLRDAVDASGEVVAPQLALIATGSEVAAALGARDLLTAAGVPTRVVSAPCLEWFAEQSAEYRESVLPTGVVRVSVEAGIAQGWRDIVGDTGAMVSIEHFGASGAAAVLAENYGFTADNVARVAQDALTAAQN